MGNTYLENRYDEKGRVIEQKLAGDACYTFTYDEKTRTNTVTDEQNNTSTHYTYDNRKDIILIKYPDGSEVKRETDKYGNLAKCTDRCGAVTTYEHDINGNLLRSKEPSGLITYYEYENGMNTKVWDNSGRHTTFTYDIKGNVTERRTLLDNDTGKENVITFEYDVYGRILKTIENDDVITLYDYEGTFPRTCRITAPNGIVTTQNYDTAGRLIEKNTEGIKETYTYTEYNKLKTYTDSEGGRTTYYYDDAWRLVKKVSPSQNWTGTIEDAGIIYEYDIMDRLISETDECGRKTEYKRSTNGDVVSIRKCGTKENYMEESIIYSYDINHNLIRKQTGSLGAESYENDACGRVIRKCLYAEKDGYIYERDTAGRITEVKDPYGNITDKYKYDLHGNVICHIHSPKVLKKLAEAEDTGKDTSVYPGDIYTYNAVGQMTTKNELLSIEADGTSLYSITTYVYDDFGQLIVEKTYAEPQSDTEMPQGESRTIRI
ncbi:MAG: hypothetical protein K2M78_00160 [Lachnospiraceae bacterium]|nr:hypothetical protein [Lachnospiraceae bacterium]